VRKINPRLLIGIRSMAQEIDRSMSRERLVATTSAFFGLLGLILASIGIYGVASFTVAQRTSEIGIRMALGARSFAVIRESLRQTSRAFAAGLALGLVTAVIAARLTSGFISGLLFGLGATDLAPIAGALVLMTLAAAIAAFQPARRATRVNPIVAIRQE
jgi:ABC-type antimicrobial peptide transport system permease subunit